MKLRPVFPALAATLASMAALVAATGSFAADTPAATPAPLATPAPKEAFPGTLTVQADRADGLYKQGEEARFTVTLSYPRKKAEAAKELVVKYTLSKDGISPALEEGTFTIDTRPLASGKALALSNTSSRLAPKTPAASADFSVLDGGILLVTASEGNSIANFHFSGVSDHLDEPGFLLCQVECLPPLPEGAPPRTQQETWKATLRASASAAFDPERIAPSLPAPDDFDAFWAAEKAKLAAVPPNVRLTPVESPDPAVVAFEVEAASLGNPLRGYLAYPRDARPGSLPAMILPHGAGVRSSSLENAAKWAGRGCLALDFNVHGLPNGQPDEYYDALAKKELAAYFMQGREDRKRAFFHDPFLRLVRAVDVLAVQPQWDGRNVIANGPSQGGGQAIAAAGLDPRITFLVAEVPALCDHTGPVVGRINGWPRLVAPPRFDAEGKWVIEVPRPPKKAEPTGTTTPASPEAAAKAEKEAAKAALATATEARQRILQTARYYDAVNFAARTKAPAFFTVGFIDGTCPPTGIYAAYNQLSGKKRIFNMPASPHRGNPETAAALLKAILEELEQMR